MEVLLHKGGYVNITLGWGLAVTMGIFVAGRVSGAHLNPAVTIGLAMASGAWSEVPAYIGGQLLGAMVGAT